MEEKQGLFKSIMSAIKSLSADYSSDDKAIEEQVAELEKIQKQIAKEQEDFGASLRVNKPQAGGKSKAKATQTKAQPQLDDEMVR